MLYYEGLHPSEARALEFEDAVLFLEERRKNRIDHYKSLANITYNSGILALYAMEPKKAPKFNKLFPWAVEKKQKSAKEIELEMLQWTKVMNKE